MRRTLIAAAMLALAACGTGTPGTITATGVPRETPAKAPEAETVRGLTAFGDALYQASADPARNIVLSPLSIGAAFGMARAGAAQATGADLDRIFGFPAAGPHTALNALTRKIVTVDGKPPVPDRNPVKAEDHKPRPPIVGLTNGLFVQDGFAVKAPFLNTLAAQYGVGVHPVDFGGNASDVIDKWAEDQTAGRIKKVFDQLDPSTKAVIANALYLKAEWKYPFAEEPEEKNAAFTRSDRSVVRTDLMRLRQQVPYATGAGWQAVELPYAESDLAMWVIVPARGAPAGPLLAPRVLDQIAAGLRPTEAEVLMPGWDFDTTIDLREKLRLGPGDYSGIADGLFLSQAVHRATITVDKWGTEAAAVTAMMFATSGRPQSEVTLRADHPFAFAIVHKPTRTPLFIGHVADPSASR